MKLGLVRAVESKRYENGVGSDIVMCSLFREVRTITNGLFYLSWNVYFWKSVLVYVFIWYDCDGVDIYFKDTVNADRVVSFYTPSVVCCC